MGGDQGDPCIEQCGPDDTAIEILSPGTCRYQRTGYIPMLAYRSSEFKGRGKLGTRKGWLKTEQGDISVK